MRILHTSDWHLGATYCDRSRAKAQRHFLDWLLRTIAEHEVDALVVAGDVFDTENPPAEALALYYGFLADLARLDAPTSTGGRRTAIVVGGNHDSASRLDAPREALRALDVHVVGGHDPTRSERDDATPSGVLVPLRDGAGRVRLVVAAVPYLNDWRLGVRGFDVEPAVQLASMHDAFGRVYTDLAAKAEALYPGVPRMATGHLTCLAERGAKTAVDDAPLPIHRVGTLGAMAPSIFDPSYGYVALGHIHRGFPVEPSGRVRYSGTPIQVSATEGPYDRKVYLVSFGDGGAHTEALPVPVRQRLLRFEGTSDALLESIGALEIPEGELPPLVALDLELPAPKPMAEQELVETIETKHPAKVDVVKVRGLVVRQGETPAAAARRALLAELTPEAVLLHAWKTKYGANAVPPDAVLQRFRSLVEKLASAEGEVTS